MAKRRWTDLLSRDGCNCVMINWQCYGDNGTGEERRATNGDSIQEAAACRLACAI